MTTAIHLMAGGTIYGSINRTDMPGKIKISLLAAALAGSIAPDIDTVSKYWNGGIMYQMWYRNFRTFLKGQVFNWNGFLYGSGTPCCNSNWAYSGSNKKNREL